MTNHTSPIHRGEIYYADLSPAVGSEQGGVRPVEGAAFPQAVGQLHGAKARFQGVGGHAAGGHVLQEAAKLVVEAVALEHRGPVAQGQSVGLEHPLPAAILGEQARIAPRSPDG